MNKYGAQARAHWEKHLPKSYRKIADAESFFSQLGEVIEDRVDELSQAIAGDDPPQESYLQKVGRLNEARTTAESDALKEMLPEPEDA
jgi:hypothetical protein